ncbi:hypothetical protein GOP47_0022869 [Adiantum capillus-veneris]|uniref:Uncharacterized protein n=1 Tax=Adiantum capillus-veneris TaxID=13818 RepID=A0A9D4U6N0_ADICA|nr:hypothetical protein GOP47_0022869 [Adiantum capillus-veneris]
MALLRGFCGGVASLQRREVAGTFMASRWFCSKQQGDWTLADELAAEEEVGSSQQPVSRALDQMFSDLRFKKLAPGWLPLRPESSFFIPPSPPLSQLLKHHAFPVQPPLSLDDLRMALNPLGWTSADAIHHRMAASQADEIPSSRAEPQGWVEIIFIGQN